MKIAILQRNKFQRFTTSGIKTKLDGGPVIGDVISFEHYYYRCLVLGNNNVPIDTSFSKPATPMVTSKDQESESAKVPAGM